MVFVHLTVLQKYKQMFVLLGEPQGSPLKGTEEKRAPSCITRMMMMMMVIRRIMMMMRRRRRSFFLSDDDIRNFFPNPN